MLLQLKQAITTVALQVGLLDIDICGPSVPNIMWLEGEDIHRDNHVWSCEMQ